MPGITMPGYIATGGRNMRTDSSSTLYRFTAQISTRSNGFGSLPGGNAYTTDTSRYAARPPIASRRNSHRGKWQRYFAAIMRNYLRLLCYKIDTSTPKLRAGQERM